MSTKYKFSWDEPEILRQIFYAGSIYFLLITIFSLIHYEEKFLLDGTSIVFYIANLEWFPGAIQREVMYLGQFIPVALSMAGLDLKWIMMGYVLNVSLFYYTLFFITIRILKDPLASILMLLLHYRGDPYNFFFMVEELLPGACLLIVLISLLRKSGQVKFPNLVYLGVIFLSFFIVRSHPLALVCLAGAVVIVFLSNPQFFSTHKRVIAITAITVGILVAVKLLTLNEYDNTMAFSPPKSLLQSTLQLLNPSYFWNILKYHVHLRHVFTVILGVTTIYLLLEKQYSTLLILFALIFGLFVLFNTQIGYDGIHSREYSNTSYDRWSLPVRFVVFAAFCFIILEKVNNRLVYRTVLFSGILFFSIGGLAYIEERKKCTTYVDQARYILRQCHDQGVKKALLRLDQLDPSVMLYYNSYTDIILFSSLQGPDSTVQVVYVNEEEIPFFLGLDEQLVVLNKNEVPRDLGYLNNRYFRLAKDKYRLIDIE